MTGFQYLIHRIAKEGVLRFLVGNKCDIENKRAVSTQQGQELARQYGINFIETSAKETTNIEDLFINVTKLYVQKNSNSIKNEKKEKNLKNSKQISIEKLSEGSKKKKGCC